MAPVPDLKVLSEIDMKTFVDTGINVRINTPLAKNARTSLFAINLDGLIPQYSLGDAAAPSIFKNLFPVQPTPDNVSNVVISQEMIQLPVQSLYMMHRMASGPVGVAFRVSSNTAQSGNISISQITAVKRNYYAQSEPYQGIRFENTSYNGTDFVSDNFALTDVSLNRNFSVTTTRRDPAYFTDIAQKLNLVRTFTFKPVSVSDILARSVMANQFLEDHLLVSILSDLPNQNANQLNIRIFMDYSKVQFRIPLAPLIMSSPEDVTKQILQFSATFNAQLNPSKPTWVWLPGVGREENEDDEAYIARKALEIVDEPAYDPAMDLYT